MKRRKNLGLWIPFEVLEVKLNGKKLKPVDRMLLAEINFLSKSGAPCRAGNKHLAKILNVSVSTISRSIHYLKDLNLISLCYINNDSRKREMETTIFKVLDKEKLDSVMESEWTPDDNFQSQANSSIQQNTNEMDPSQIDLSQNDLSQFDVDPCQNDIDPSQIDIDPCQNDVDPSQIDIHRKPLENHLENNKNTFRYFFSKNEKKQKRKSRIEFLKSEIGQLENFLLAFEGTDYAQADLPFYYEKVKAWAAQGNERSDWVAVAQMFMLNDRQNKKLMLNPKVKSYENSIIDPEQIKRVVENINRKYSEEETDLHQDGATETDT